MCDSVTGSQQPYALTQSEKDRLFQKELSALSVWHQQNCIPYQRLCSALETSMPLLPVSAFRDQDLMSVPRETIVRELISSGTSNQKPSRIFLDSEAAEKQQEVLLQILEDFLGKERLPMLIIDARSTASRSADFSARRAGIAGFALLTSSRTWALNDQMQPDLETICRFAKEHKGQRTLIFGFTYMIRQYLTLPLLESGLTPDLSQAVLIHGGGWKKMEELAVSPEQFKTELAQVAGIHNVHNYYGMTEQLGSIFMECEYGHIHTNRWADIRILHPENFSECDNREQGVVSLCSVLPVSYPGHYILTEDLGRILGTDDCPCGRKGRYFAIDGRVPHAEIRGCSDAFAENNMSRYSSPSEEIRILVGSEECLTNNSGTIDSFHSTTLSCLESLSWKLFHDRTCRAFPEIVSFGFWLRKAHLEQLHERYPESRKGSGHVLITAPANMPILFAYNWAVSMLAGCSCTIRISEHASSAADQLCRILGIHLQNPEYAALYQRTSIVRFPHSDQKIRQLSNTADIRIFWGGDKTISKLHEIPPKKGCLDILFPNRYSISLLSARSVSALSEDDLLQLCDRFYRDTYEADQNACSSPKIVFWINDFTCDPKKQSCHSADLQKTRQIWWKTLASIVRDRYHPETETLLTKYSLLVRQLLSHEDLRVQFYAGNLLMAVDIRISELSLSAENWSSFAADACFGLFYECILKDLQNIPSDFGDKLQTVTIYGLSVEETLKNLLRSRTYEALRIVSVGEALSFDPVWDGKDLIRRLSIPL